MNAIQRSLSRRLLQQLDSKRSIRRILPRKRQSSSHRSSPSRPQVQFLAPSNRILARLLSTDQRNGFGQTAKDFVKWSGIICAFSCFFAIAKFGVENELLEHQHPTPPTWSWISRWKLRSAQGDEAADPGILPDWVAVGANYEQLIDRLEDVGGDGRGVQPQLGEGEEIFVEGIGKTGLDISNMPGPWRQGYHQVLMGAARAAEHLETFVRDKTRGFVFHQSMVIGPSNPRPKPVPYGSKSAPNEADCEPAFKLPHVYYMKVLTTHGFTSRQRLDAALAYANWLRYKGLNGSAEDMYAWAFDIATHELPQTMPPLIDKSTGILGPETSKISPNLILAASSIATHHAQTGNMEAALPVFLSVLRAQRNLPIPTESVPAVTTFPGLLRKAIAFILPPAYPPTPPSGDEPATATPTNTCASAGTMLNIGEILYASETSNPLASSQPSPSQVSGLSWTSQAMDLAEATLRELASPEESSEQQSRRPTMIQHNSAKETHSMEAKKRCAECLNAGLKNWHAMLRRFQDAEIRNAAKRPAEQASENGEDGRTNSKHWFWGKPLSDSKEPSPPKAEIPAQDVYDRFNGIWVQEGRKLQQRAVSIRRLMREHGLDR